jgi:myo-inositol 2-dehydrogenase/D-chiro-inositol 1-dehydrogenase
MNFLILGDGAEELAWARAIARDPSQRLLAAYPGFDLEEFPELKRPADFEDALALAELEAVVVGGAIASRGESLRRVAAVGLPAICLHPPGDDSEAYYQVALSREETGAIVIPDLPGRLHPALASLRKEVERPELGGFRGLTVKGAAGPGAGDLTRHVIPRLVDPVRALIGEIEAITAMGDPPGPRPTESLIVQLRGPAARRAEVRIERGSADDAPGQLVLSTAAGSITLEHSPTWDGPARLIRRSAAGAESVAPLEAWDPHAAILSVLMEAAGGRDQFAHPHPNLIDGTRAMELAEAAVRSLTRGRTVDLHYEEISEAATFKSVMTSIGCLVFLAVLIVLPAALIGPPLGFPGTLYIAYAIPPTLVLYILVQLFRFALRDRRREKPVSEGRSGPRATSSA